MPEVIELEFHSKELSDFQLSRLVRASLRKYTVPITAFICTSWMLDLVIRREHQKKASGGGHHRLRCVRKVEPRALPI